MAGHVSEMDDDGGSGQSPREAATLREAAIGGSGRAQYELGCHLLSTSSNDVNAVEAIEWLVKASKNCVDEATSLLKKCADEQHDGITEGNVDDVKWCLSISTAEKSLRLAASEVYKQLTSNCKDEKLPTHRYYERVKDFATEKKEKKFLDSTGKKLQNPDEVKEDDFVETVTRRMRSGQIDPTENDKEMMAFSQASLERKITKYPGISIAIAMDTVLEAVTTDGVNLVMTFIPFDQLNVLIIFFMLSLLSARWLLGVCSIGVFYLLLVVMIVCTIQMFKTKKKQSEVKSMATMMRRYNDKIDPDQVVAMFVENSMKPYWTFMTALPFFLMAFYLSSKTWIPCAEMVTISWGFSLAALIYLTRDSRKEPLMNIVTSLTLLSSFPVLFHGFPRIPLVYYIIKFLTSSLFSMDLMAGFSLHVSLPAIAYLVLPALIIKLAVTKSWDGIYRVLIPHIVAIVWWEIGVIFYMDASWLGLARSSLAWPVFFLLLPVLSVVGLFVGIYNAFQVLGVTTFITVAITLALLSVPVLLSVWQESGYTAGKLSLRGKSLKVKLAVVIIPVILLIVGAVFSGDEADGADTVGGVSWELYRDLCSKPAWARSNMAAAQVACAEMKYMEVKWTGRVQSITVTEVENPADDFLSNLPDGIAEWLKCLYGTPFSRDEVETDGEFDEGVSRRETSGDSTVPPLTDQDKADDDHSNEETNCGGCKNENDDDKEATDEGGGDEMSTEEDNGDGEAIEEGLGEGEAIEEDDGQETIEEGDGGEEAIEEDNGEEAIEESDGEEGATEESDGEEEAIEGDVEEEAMEEGDVEEGATEESDGEEEAIEGDVEEEAMEEGDGEEGATEESDGEEEAIEGDVEEEAMEEGDGDEKAIEVDGEEEAIEEDDSEAEALEEDDGEEEAIEEDDSEDEAIEEDDSEEEAIEEVGEDEAMEKDSDGEGPIDVDVTEEVATDDDFDKDEGDISITETLDPDCNGAVDSEENNVQENSKEKRLKLQLRSLRQKYGRTCHMDDHASYSFLVFVSMPTGGTTDEIVIPVSADNGFKKTLLALKTGDVIQYEAMFEGGLGSAAPKLSLLRVKCISCLALNQNVMSEKEGSYFIKAFGGAVMKTIDFFTSPFITLDS